MQLDKNFVRNLGVPFNQVLPNGALVALRGQFDVSEHTPRKILSGEWSNPAFVLAALNLIREHHELLDRFIRQFPIQEP